MADNDNDNVIRPPGKKRRKVCNSNNSTVGKKRKSDDSYSFTGSQKDTLAQAALLLQHSRPALSAALNKIVSQRAKMSPKSPCQAGQRDSRTDASSAMVRTSPMLAMPQPPNSVRSGEMDPFLPEHQYPNNNNPLVDYSRSMFGTGFLPEQIAECFASFVPNICDPFVPVDDMQQTVDTVADFNGIPPMSQVNQQAAFQSEFQFWENETALPSTYACDALSETWFPEQLYPALPTQQVPTEQGPHSADATIFENEPFPQDLIDFSIPEPPPLLDVPPLEEPTSNGIQPSPNHGPRKTPKARGPFRNELDRQQTAQTRKLTACIRCRMQRIKCEPDPNDPHGVCLTCKRVLRPKMSKLPCLRYKITEIRLFKGTGPLATGYAYSRRWSDAQMHNVTEWASPEIRTIKVTQEYGNEPGLTFRVRKFIPVEGDVLNRWWADGSVIKSIDVPTYAMVDMKEALLEFQRYIISAGPEHFSGTLKDYGRLAWFTYTEALSFANLAKTELERKLLRSILQLWVTIRKCTKSLRLCGQDTLGMSSDVFDKSSPMHGKIPTPPVFDAQFDVIISQMTLMPLRAKVLDLLQQITLAQKPSNWFCIYLCTFILLHNSSLLTIHDISYVHKYGLKTRHARLEMVQELHFGANVLLAHFHYCCKGFRPFSLDWKAEKTTSMAELNPQQIQFVYQTACYVKANGKLPTQLAFNTFANKPELRFKQILEDKVYGDEDYLVAQLYEVDWKPRTVV